MMVHWGSAGSPDEHRPPVGSLAKPMGAIQTRFAGQYGDPSVASLNAERAEGSQSVDGLLFPSRAMEIHGKKHH